MVYGCGTDRRDGAGGGSQVTLDIGRDRYVCLEAVVLEWQRAVVTRQRKLYASACIKGLKLLCDL
jgi:hypothetical protein